MFSKLVCYCTFRDNFFTLSFDYKRSIKLHGFDIS